MIPVAVDLDHMTEVVKLSVAEDFIISTDLLTVLTAEESNLTPGILILSLNRLPTSPSRLEEIQRPLAH